MYYSMMCVCDDIMYDNIFVITFFFYFLHPRFCNKIMFMYSSLWHFLYNRCAK